MVLGLREKIKRVLRRILHLPGADEGEEGHVVVLHLPDADEGEEGHMVESTGDSEAKSDQQPLQLPHVQLHFSSTLDATADSEISEAQIALKKSVTKLESVLQAQLGQSSDKLQTSLAECLAQSDNPRHLEPLIDICIAVGNKEVGRTQAVLSRAGAVMQKMYPLTKLALGLTGTLTSSLGYAPVQIVTNGLIQAFELAMNTRKQSEEVVAGLDSLATDDYLLAELQKMPVDVLDRPIVLGAIVLQTQLIEFLRKSILWLNKTFFAKFSNGLIDPTQMADTRTELRKAQDVLRNHLSVDTFLTMKWQQIVTSQAEELNSLCSNKYHKAHLDKQNELHSTRLENSGNWAVNDEKFKSWHGDTGGIIWCPGLPGAGKTYLVSRIVDELQIAGRHLDVDIGVAYVYCEYNPAQKQSEKLVIEAMTRQLIAQKPDLCSEFRQFLGDSLATTLADRKKLLRNVIARFETSYLVLDALDEFSTDYGDRHRLACSLRDIVQDCSTRQARLCITSREADGIWQSLSTGTVPAKFLDVQSSQSDIRALVEKAYDEASRDGAIEWTCGNDELRQLVMDKVVEKSACIFKLADLQIRAILQKPSAKLARSALDRLTNNVNDYYNEAMERIASQKETKDMVYNLLTWLTFTRSPIHIHELELALSIRPGHSLDHDLNGQRVDVLRFVSLSEGLISINKSSLISLFDGGSNRDYGTPQGEITTMNAHKISHIKGAQVILAHESIREFLRDNPQPGSPANGDKYLLHCCLTIMSSPMFIRNLQSIWIQLLYREEFPRRAEYGYSIHFEDSAVEVPAFLFWVLSSWGQHVREGDITPEMASAIQKIHQSAAVATGTLMSMAKSSSKMRPFAGPLYWCAYEGWAEACKLLLPLEEEPSAFWQLMLDRGLARMTRETCLFAAVASGDVATVQVFLGDDRVAPNLGKKSHCEGYVTPLMRACKQGNPDIVRMFLTRNDVDVNTCDDDGGYGEGLPAILQAEPGITALLLERDDLNTNILRLGRRPVHHLANIGGPPSELELLLNHAKTEVNSRTQGFILGIKYLDAREMACFCNDRTALMVAAFVGHPAQTSVLLKHPRIDVHLRDSQGTTALMLASVGWRPGTRYDKRKKAELQNSVQQNDETVRVLLTTSDSEINEQDMRGRTALMFASMGGVDPRWIISDSFGESRMTRVDSTYWYKDLAIKSSQGKDHHVKIVKALLSNDKVDVNIPDDMGHTALDYAMWTRHFIIQEHDWKMRNLKRRFESLRGGGPGVNGCYKVPNIDVRDIMTKAQSRFDAMSKIHDILVASGAHSGEPIGPLAILQDQDRTTSHISLVDVEPSEQQKMLDNLFSALDNIV